jgi:hypothetical protein
MFKNVIPRLILVLSLPLYLLAVVGHFESNYSVNRIRILLLILYYTDCQRSKCVAEKKLFCPEPES